MIKIIITSLALLMLVTSANAGMHRTPAKQKSAIPQGMTYNEYKYWYKKNAQRNLQANKRAGNWANHSKQYRSNPQPSNPAPYYPTYRQSKPKQNRVN